jgi:methylmalonyl-CoA/ethylmalonyl-CoA epimerase
MIDHSHDYEVMGLEEVVIAVKSIDKAVRFFNETFGFKFECGWILDNEGIRIGSERLGDTQFQLMEPTDKNSIVYSFLEKHGEGLHHIAFRVRGLENLVNRLRDKGVRLIPDKPIEIDNPVGGGRLKYIFIHPKAAHGTLIELIEYID